MNNINSKIDKNIKLQYVIIFLLIVNLFAIILTNESNDKITYNENFDISDFKTISLRNLEENINTANIKVLIIGKPNCEYTNQMLPVLKKAQKEFGYETLYVDLRTVTEEDKEVFFNYDDETNFLKDYLGTTPLVVVFKENKMLDTWVGYQDYPVFKSFLIQLGIEPKEN